MFKISEKNKYLMVNKNKLFGFKLNKDSDFVEIGGGEGDLSLNLKTQGYNLVLFVEPDIKKYEVACIKLNNILCLNIDVEELSADLIKPKSKKVTVIMQDVIEHISFDKQKVLFQILFRKYEEICFLGRTPNLKSPFGLRNSFGDNTHLHRFTDISLKNFLEKLDFKKTITAKEDYEITGIVSLLRYPLYFLIVLSISLVFLFIFGSWEGMLTPNITFKSEKVK